MKQCLYLELASWAYMNPVHHPLCRFIEEKGHCCDCGGYEFRLHLSEDDKKLLRETYHRRRLGDSVWIEQKQALYNPVYRPPAAPDIPSGMPNDKWEGLVMGIGLVFAACLLAFCLSK